MAEGRPPRAQPDRPLRAAGTAGLILAAGASSRFGTPKALARLEGRPLLEHVLEAAHAAGLNPIVVVLGAAAGQIEAETAWRGERRLRNRDPSRGLASSLQLGLVEIAAIEPAVDGALVLLADQPRTRPDVIAALVSAGDDPQRPIVVPRYDGGGGGNPVFVARSAFALARDASGDRGLGPLIEAHPELVVEVPVDGANPDVDTRADLAALAEAAWAERVRANREQVDRVREAPDGPDFYRSVSSIFRADPRRTRDPVLAGLVSLVRREDVVLDIGAGAGRYALPLALTVREVIAIDPSASMLDGLREGMGEHGIRNVRPIQARWPDDAERLGPSPNADVALIAHVAYDIEAIGSFLGAMELATRRLCIAVMMERSPASLAEPFWPEVHGEARIPLPALPALIELLEARGAAPTVVMVQGERRQWASRDELVAGLRRQTWTAPGSRKDGRLLAAIEREAIDEGDGRVTFRAAPQLAIGVVSWTPSTSPSGD